NGKSPYSTVTKFHGVLPVMYVMDTSERLFIADGLKTGGGNFNHSSVLSGAPCLCAGNLGIDGSGKLVYIDNDSGHYKPTTADLKECVRVLVNKFDIHTFGVKVKDKATNKEQSIYSFLH